jgi:RND family efflux transporter MFP subunit
VKAVKQFATGILMIGLFLECACDSSRPTVMAAANAAPAAQPVSTEPAKPKELIISGPLVVENQVDVGAQREGVIATIAVELGTRVQKGQILAQLDDRQVAADLEAAQAKTRSTVADLHNWEAEAKVLDVDLRRAEKLWDAGVISKEQAEHARYKAESDHWDVERVQELLVNAQASEHSLEQELEKTRVRAPFDGVIARRYVRVGQKVGLGERLFWVSAESPLRMRVTLPEALMGHIQKGQQFKLTSADAESEHRQARVIEISPVVDPGSGTIEALCELIGPPGQLRPGMTAQLRVPDPR